MKKNLDSVRELMREARESGIVSSKTDPSEMIIEPLSEWIAEELDRREKIIKKIKKLLKKLR